MTIRYGTISDSLTLSETPNSHPTRLADTFSQTDSFAGTIPRINEEIELDDEFITNWVIAPWDNELEIVEAFESQWLQPSQVMEEITLVDAFDSSQSVIANPERMFDTVVMDDVFSVNVSISGVYSETLVFNERIVGFCSVTNVASKRYRTQNIYAPRSP